MKLRNKKTGEIGYLTTDTVDRRLRVLNDNNDTVDEYNSLAELNEEWEDYEEPKEKGYFIDIRARKIKVVADISLARCKRRSFQELGLYFDTQEEAEKAVEKLKAFKRLKDRGFKFIGWKNGKIEYWKNSKIEYPDHVSFYCEDYAGCEKDLDLLFGGEE